MCIRDRHWAAEAGVSPVVPKLLALAEKHYWTDASLEDDELFTRLSAAKPDNSGKLPLHVAAAAGHSGLCKLLLERNPNTLTAQDFIQRQTVLHCAATSGDAELVALLLEAGAVDSTDADGNTAADVAVRAGHNNCGVLITQSI
eukprot:TRINITY_DN36648_c0_g1_i2.p1 TRINITY_DN36648_c0_g1~~TRINITY_DN36648_c0_g1_i2.p1  ORF type:complete len:144 (+),score=40.86 TRINITY_DN36648_c0_g1_i2:150-581(+)